MELLPKTLSKRNPTYKTYVIASFTHANVFWKVFEFSFLVLHQVSLAGTLTKSDFVKIDTIKGATLHSDSSFTLATRFPVLDEE